MIVLNIILIFISLYAAGVTIMFGAGKDIYKDKGMYLTHVGMGIGSTLALSAINTVNAIGGLTFLYVVAGIYLLCACGYTYLCFKSKREEWTKTTKIIAILTGAITIVCGVLGVIFNPDLH